MYSVFPKKIEMLLLSDAAVTCLGSPRRLREPNYKQALEDSMIFLEKAKRGYLLMRLRTITGNSLEAFGALELFLRTERRIRQKQADRKSAVREEIEALLNQKIADLKSINDGEISLKNNELERLLEFFRTMRTQLLLDNAGPIEKLGGSLCF